MSWQAKCRTLMAQEPDVLGFCTRLKKRGKRSFIRIYAAIGSRVKVPKRIDGKPVQVLRTGRMMEQKFRPLIGGISFGNAVPHTGTLGYFLKDGSGHWVGLSACHVLYDPTVVNELQPGAADGGVGPNDNAGKLLLYTPPGTKRDLALADLDVGAKAELNGLGIVPTGTDDPSEGMTVVKSGNTTGVTYGVVTDTDLEYKVSGQVRERVMLIEGKSRLFSARGDSGSVILDPVRENAVGVLIGGADERTIAHHWSVVDRAFPNYLLVLPGDPYK